MLNGRNIAKMDVRLTVEYVTQSRNSINEPENSWSTFATLWAKRIWKNSQEKFEGKQETGFDAVEFHARYNPNITTTMRFKQDQESTYFYIIDVSASRREDLTIILAQRRDNQ